jgi:uncharacterized protein (DUF433 family)
LEDEAIEAANRTGQARPITIDLASVAVDVDEAIARLPERLPEEIGQVIRRRAIMRGVPIIAGTRIPTETIAWFHDQGYSLAWILKNYPRLTPRDVQAAVDYENARVAKTSDVVMASG